MKKILVLCDYGQTRSVAMATVLRERGHFAVAGSYDNFYTKLGLIKKEWDWFDTNITIIFIQEGGEHFIGRDKWSDCTHPELIRKCQE